MSRVVSVFSSVRLSVRNSATSGLYLTPRSGTAGEEEGGDDGSAEADSEPLVVVEGGGDDEVAAGVS